jgi:hypothetical protein
MQPKTRRLRPSATDTNRTPDNIQEKGGPPVRTRHTPRTRWWDGLPPLLVLAGGLLVVPLWAAGMALQVAWKMLQAAAWTVGAVVYVSVQGRYRAQIAPMWVAVVVLAPWPAPWPTGAWLTPAAVWAAVGLALLAAWKLTPADPRVLSKRERRVLAAGVLSGAGWHLAWPILPTAWWLLGAVVVTVVAAWPWWMGRRIRPHAPTPRPENETLWEECITTNPTAGALRGSVLTVDPDTGHGHLIGVPANGDLSGLDDDAARHLSRPHGTVSISRDPTGGANDYLVAFTTREDPRAVRWWDGPSLDDQGRFVVGETRSGAPVYGRLWRPGGAAFSLILGGPGSGKGNLIRVLGTEAALDPRVWMAVVDCKGLDAGGSGVPEIRDGADLYARLRPEWEAAVLMTHEVMGARAERYGVEGRSRWSPSVDPLFLLLIDELRRLISAYPKLRGPLEEIAALGRSFGIGLGVDTQVGKADDLVSTGFRANVRANGSVFAGAPGDIQAANAASQEWSIDFRRLPPEPGWMFAVSSIDAHPAEPFRGRRLPSGPECEDEHVAAPHGTAEEWMGRAARARLHPQDAQIVAEWRERLAAAETPAPAPEDTASPRPALSLVEDRRLPARERILAATPSPDGWAPPREIFDKAAVTRDHGKVLLRQLVEAGAIVRDGDGNNTRYQRRTA